MNSVLSTLKLKCPKCRKGNLFINQNPYALRQLNKMNKCCSNCNLKFVIEPGFYQGAAYVSYALQILTSIVIFNLFFWFTSLTINQILIMICFSIIVMTPYYVVLSRSVWLAFFVPFDKEK